MNIIIKQCEVLTEGAPARPRAAVVVRVVGRFRLTVSNTVLKAPLVSVLEATI